MSQLDFKISTKLLLCFVAILGNMSATWAGNQSLLKKKTRNSIQFHALGDESPQSPETEESNPFESESFNPADEIASSLSPLGSLQTKDLTETWYQSEKIAIAEWFWNKNSKFSREDKASLNITLTDSDQKLLRLVLKNESEVPSHLTSFVKKLIQNSTALSRLFHFDEGTTIPLPQITGLNPSRNDRFYLPWQGSKPTAFQFSNVHHLLQFIFSDLQHNKPGAAQDLIIKHQNALERLEELKRGQLPGLTHLEFFKIIDYFHPTLQEKVYVLLLDQVFTLLSQFQLGDLLERTPHLPPTFFIRELIRTRTQLEAHELISIMEKSNSDKSIWNDLFRYYEMATQNKLSRLKNYLNQIDSTHFSISLESAVAWIGWTVSQTNQWNIIEEYDQILSNLINPRNCQGAFQISFQDIIEKNGFAFHQVLERLEHQVSGNVRTEEVQNHFMDFIELLKVQRRENTKLHSSNFVHLLSILLNTPTVYYSNEKPLLGLRDRIRKEFQNPSKKKSTTWTATDLLNLNVSIQLSLFDKALELTDSLANLTKDEGQKILKDLNLIMTQSNLKTIEGKSRGKENLKDATQRGVSKEALKQYFMKRLSEKLPNIKIII